MQQRCLFADPPTEPELPYVIWLVLRDNGTLNDWSHTLERLVQGLGHDGQTLTREEILRRADAHAERLKELMTAIEDWQRELDRYQHELAGV